MKRFVVFILLGPVLFALCILGLFLPVASLVTVGAVRFDIEVDSYLGVLLGLMFGGFFLALVDWLAQMLAMRPWFTGAVGWAIGAVLIGTWFDVSVWWWFVVKGLLVGIPALACSWLSSEKQKESTGA